MSVNDLTPEELDRIDQIKQAVDVRDPQVVVQYGLPAQSRLATFADTLLNDVRTKDTGDAGKELTDLLVKVRELDVDGLVGGLAGRTHPARRPLPRLLQALQRRATRRSRPNVERLLDALERTRMGLLKDVTVLDKMYELNLEYLEAARPLHRRRRRDPRRPADETAAGPRGRGARRQRPPRRRSGSPTSSSPSMRFERRLHDLKLTRMIAIQTAPQIRLIQNNDQNLVEKIQSSITNTIPLWKNQIVIALSLYRQQQALELQKEVTDTANELLAKNAELLKTGSAKVGREVERGIVDIEVAQEGQRRPRADARRDDPHPAGRPPEAHRRRVRAGAPAGRPQAEDDRAEGVGPGGRA